MFKKGDPKPPGSGMKKGQKQKKRVPLVTEFLGEKGINPAQEIIKLLPSLSPDEQLSAWKSLLSYTQPKVTEVFSPAASPEVPEQDVPSAQLLSLVKPIPTTKAEGSN